MNSFEEERLVICRACPNNKDYSNSSVFTFISKLGVSVEEVAKEVCDVCKCPIRYRVKKAKMSCPINKWSKAE